MEFIAGVLLWTLTEYGVHRYVAHWRDRDCEHHFDPYDYSVGPSWRAVFTWLAALLGVSLATGTLALYAGFTLGYASYAIIHYLCHHHLRLDWRWLRALRRAHNIHHWQDDHANFGVTSPLWDWVFGTYREPHAKATAIRHRSQRASP